MTVLDDSEARERKAGGALGTNSQRISCTQFSRDSQPRDARSSKTCDCPSFARRD